MIQEANKNFSLASPVNRERITCSAMKINQGSSIGSNFNDRIFNDSYNLAVGPNLLGRCDSLKCRTNKSLPNLHSRRRSRSSNSHSFQMKREGELFV